MGCETEMAFNARTGIDAAKRSSPDLVFCDLRLPGEQDGFDVARQLPADATFVERPLIVVLYSLNNRRVTAMLNPPYELVAQPGYLIFRSFIAFSPSIS
jgi:CheY-like chemotaxis protein